MKQQVRTRPGQRCCARSGLGILGILDTTQQASLANTTGASPVAVLAIAPIVQAVWTRFGLWAGRTAALIAFENAKAPPGTPPTLAPPP